MTLTKKTQKNPIYERIFLSFMTLSHIWPLVTEKAKKTDFDPFLEISKTSVLAFSATRGQK